MDDRGARRVAGEDRRRIEELLGRLGDPVVGDPVVARDLSREARVVVDRIHSAELDRGSGDVSEAVGRDRVVLTPGSEVDPDGAQVPEPVARIVT